MAGRKREVPKMGRPPGPPEQVRRNRVAIMLTDAEFEVVERLAADQAVPLGTALYRLVSRALRLK